MRLINWLKSLFTKKPKPISKLDLSKGQCWVINGIKGTFRKHDPVKVRIKNFSAVEKDPRRALRFYFDQKETLTVVNNLCTAPKAVHIVLSGIIVRKLQSGFMITRLDGRALTHNEINQILKP